MVTDKLKELEAAKARLAELQQAVARQLHQELAALPAKYGFDSVREFTRAVAKAAQGRGSRKRSARKAAPRKAAGRRRRRAVITDATRSEVKKLSESGKTGAQIARQVGISLPSVQNVKKALGLVKARK